MAEADQLILDLPVATSRARGDFLVAPSNALAFRTVETWPDWPGGKLLVTGPTGAGKSHLAALWQERSGARLLTPDDLDRADAGALAREPVLFEDAEQVAGHALREEALFHLYNALHSAGLSLMLTAPSPPRDWGLSLPDLQSRLRAIATVRIDPPDDALLAAVLVKLFADRQIAVPPNVITFLTPRMERSLATAARLVEAIDTLALTEKRDVTRRLAARALEALDNAADPGA